MSLIFIVAVAFGVTVLAIVSLIPLAGRLKLLALPGGHRVHGRPTPVVGGVAIFAGLVAGMSFAGPLDASVLAYLLGILMLALVGIWDDRRGCSPTVRFLVQITAASVLVVFGNVVILDMGNLLGLGSIQLGWMALPFTVFAIVGLTNAINMLDGLDGLAGSVCLTIGLPLVYVAVSSGAEAQLTYILVFMASVAGFLCFNLQYRRRPAHTFMGDTGSMLLGYTLAWLVITLSQEPIAGIRPMSVLWLLIVPVFDTFRLIALRVRDRVSPFSPDSRHLHHLLVRAGWSVNQVVLVGCAATLVSSVIALFVESMPAADPILFYGYACLFFLYLGLCALLASANEPASHSPVELR